MAGGIQQGQLSEDIKIGGSTEIIKTQVGHGFSLHQPIYHNGVTWVVAQADNENTLAEYIVTEIEDANNFLATKFGEVEATAHGFTVGEHYFLDDAVAGGVTLSQPGTFSCPVFYVEDANTLHVEIYRPFAVNEAHSTLQDARGDADGSVTEGCTITTEGIVPNMSTQVVLDAPFTYTTGRNLGGVYGDLVISVNGQRIERFTSGINDSTGEIGYEEINNSTIRISTKTASGSDQLPAGAIINISRVEVTNGLAPDKKGKWQKKIMTSSNTPSQMNWNNLVPGNTYEVALHVGIQCNNNNKYVYANHNGSPILKVGTQQLYAPNPNDEHFGSETTFTATATTVTFTQTGGATLSANDSWSRIKDITDFYLETSEYT